MLGETLTGTYVQVSMLQCCNNLARNLRSSVSLYCPR